MYRFPVYGYTTLADLKKLNNNKYITTFNEMITVATTKLPNATHRERIKTQVPHLANMYGHLTNSGLDKFHAIIDAFQVTPDRALHMQMFRYMLNYFEGLGPTFLFMLDSGQYQRFFQLIVDIPGIASQVGSQMASNSNENFYYCLIPWIATNRLGDFSETHWNLIKVKPIVAALLKVETGVFGTFWAKALIDSKMRGVEFPAGYKEKIAALPNVDELLQGYDTFQRIYLGIKPVTITAELSALLRQAVENTNGVNINKGATITSNDLNRLSYKRNIPIAELDKFRDLVAYGYMTFSNFDTSLETIAASNDLQYRLAPKMKTWTGKFAKTLLAEAKKDANWQLVKYDTYTDLSRVRAEIKALSNRNTIPLLIFYAFGTTSDPNPTSTQASVFAMRSENDNGDEYKAKAKDILANKVDFDSLAHGNCAYRIDSRDKMDEFVQGVWFRELDAINLSPGSQLGVFIYFKYVYIWRYNCF